MNRTESALDWDLRGLLLLKGKKPFWFAHAFVAQLVLQGVDLFLVDCAIRWDVFEVVDILENQGEDPEFFLDKILIQRAFTPYQILDSVSRICHDPRLDTVYIFLAPFKQFFDGDVQQEEAHFLLKKLFQKWELCKQKGIPLVIVEKEHYSSPLFVSLVPALEEIVTQKWVFQSMEKFKDESLFS